MASASFWRVDGVVLIQAGPPVSEDLYLYAYEFHKIQHTLSLGAAMLLGIALVKRDLRSPAYEWTGSFPVSSLVPFGTKFAAGFLYLSLFTLAMDAVYAWFAWRLDYPAGILVRELLFFTGQYEWSYAVTLLLAMVLAAGIPGRTAYLIGFCAWVFGTYFLDAFVISRQRLFVLRTFHLSQLQLNTFYESEVWGPWIQAGERTASRLFVLVFLLLLAAVGIVLLQRARPSRSARAWAAGSLVLLLASAAAFVPYGQLWAARYKAQAAKLEAALDYAADNGTRSFTTFGVKEYQIQARQTTSGTVRFTALLRLPTDGLPAQGPLPFTLNQAYAVKQVKWNGKELPVSRRHDLLLIEPSRLEPALAEQTLAVEYEGGAPDWYYQGETEVMGSFVKDEYVLLPSSEAWYPIPGDEPLHFRNGGELIQVRGGRMKGSSDFKVTLEGFKGRIYGTLPGKEQPDGRQVYEGRNADGLSLFGGQLIEVTSPGEPLKVITSPGNRKEAQRFLDDIAAEKRYYRTWLPLSDEMLEKIFYFPTSHWGEGKYAEQELTGNSTVIGETKNHNLDDVQKTATVQAVLYGDVDIHASFTENRESPPDGGPVSWAAEVRKAIRYLYLLDGKGLTPEEVAQSHGLAAMLYLPEPLGTDPKNGDGRFITEGINRAVAEGKADKVKELLRGYYEKGLGIRESSADGEPAYPVITAEQWNRDWKRVVGP
ncbi:hypothetical protein N6H14_08155 [Paenibacillus sp. CC-CFT747]|nr:hypothetical protein N6H14_08155 [Paenibacillus sp. CC-CFT747]